MEHEENDDVPDGPLSPAENRQLRVMLRDDGRARWFWSTVRIWAGYISAAVIGAGAVAAAIREFWKVH